MTSYRFLLELTVTVDNEETMTAAATMIVTDRKTQALGVNTPPTLEQAALQCVLNRLLKLGDGNDGLRVGTSKIGLGHFDEPILLDPTGTP